ncbi:PEP-CTERM sorting domain-containing protein [Dolichospermum flos-aquae]|uniref:PEP-CTERM sorting domain-containing protein n=1 Tax=Dolichospermum flos-aquae LEGE 04289 TaxID=1828708 RepID=A0ACC5Q3U4_DOLFA|nr:PEP-CTERM sorting domain-containing protein [Dolichospermum flos-aquae]MBE9219599.1 PEP-CTERM sorting domain-containing protein [Dolichospermum flos-aquae LEGE 04289]
MIKLSQILPLVVVGGALATSLVAWEKPAQAIQVFNFSFNNVIGGVNGTVSGTLDLPNGDGIFAATSMKINSAPADLGYTQPVDVLSYFTSVVNNSFTVSNGTITASSFFATRNDKEAILLSYAFIPSTTVSALSKVGAGDVSSGVGDIYSATLTYSPATPVPFDTTPGAMLSTIPILALMYLWKQSRNRMALKTINNPDVTVSTYRQVG